MCIRDRQLEHTAYAAPYTVHNERAQHKMCIRDRSTALLASFLVLSAAAPHLAHLAGPLPGFFINLASIAFLILFGCHEPRMFNQSTLVLGYLLLYRCV